MKSVPGGVLEEEVSSCAVVDEDHERDADAAERVERAEPLLLGALLLLLGPNSIEKNLDFWLEKSLEF